LALQRVGFAWPTGYPAAGALLPRRFTLTAPGGRTPHYRPAEAGQRGGIISVALSL